MRIDAEIMAQVLAAFQDEQAEHRQAIGEILIELERCPAHPQRQRLLDQLFREAHSLKGGARAADQPEVERIAHQIEDLFSAVRQGALQLTPEVCDPIHAALDAIGELMGLVAAGQPADLAPHAALLDALARASGTVPRASSPPQDAPARNGGAPEPRPPDVAPQEAGPQAGATVRIATASLDVLMNETGELLTCSLRSKQHARDTLVLAERAGAWRRTWRRVRTVYDQLQEQVPAVRPAVHYLDGRDDPPPAPPAHGLGREAEVILAALKQANTMIDELAAQLQQEGHRMAEDSAQLSAVVDRMQGHVRRARMLPLKSIAGQLRLHARDIARAGGKRVALVFEDGAAEVDREILERLRDVLLHLLRNAIDHGVEPAELRAARGKPPEGSITLRAGIAGDRLLLSMADDGAGLDLAAIRQRALAGQLVGEADLRRMSDADVAQLIFLPGLSTRQSVGALSGRGVGLDIVRAHIERMRGRVEVETQLGEGCQFTISVPLSLMSSRGLLLQAGGGRYALPLDTVQRIVAVAPGQVRALEGRAALVLDDRPLPVADLADLLGGGTAPGRPSRAQLALVMGDGERQVACLVGAVLGEQEMIAHRLPPPLRQVRFVAGATILPDGCVVPILDVVDLVAAIHGARRPPSPAAEPQAAQRSHTILVVDDSITTRTLEKNILEAAGYRVRLATDGVEALQLLEQLASDGGCDLLLSDVDMPRLNGFDLTAQVRAHPHYRTLPIVLVTSLDTPADRERGISAGADSYIVKRTFDQQTLLEMIAQYLT